MSHVLIRPGDVTHSIYLAYLPQEIPADTIKKAMEEFGTIYDIRDEVMVSGIQVQG